MANISWIEEIYNTTDVTFVMWSTDDTHNGVAREFESNKEVGNNDWGGIIVLKPGARYKADWMGIPWYTKDHYRVIAKVDDANKFNKDKKPNYGLRMYQANVNDGDWIHFCDHYSGKDIDGTALPLPGGADRKFALTIFPGVKPGDPPCIELELREAKYNWQTFLEDFSKSYAEDYYEFYKEMRSEAGKALIGLAAKKAGG